MEFGYARVSTDKQDLERQIEALAEAGLARERIYVNKKLAATSSTVIAGMRLLLRPILSDPRSRS